MTRWLLAWVLMTGTACADQPPLAFFAGHYRMIGVDAQGPVDRSLRLAPFDDRLAVTGCAGLTGALRFETGFEMTYLTGRIGTHDVNCQFFMDNDNYPLLACYGEAGERLTLWPDNKGSTDAPLDCTTP